MARELLSDTGSIFVQIGDENVHRVRVLLDEVFGSANFITLDQLREDCEQHESASSAAPWTTSSGIAKDKEQLKYRPLYRERPTTKSTDDAYVWVELADGMRRRMTPDERANPTCFLPAHGASGWII